MFALKAKLEFKAAEMGGIYNLEIECLCNNTKDVVREIVKQVNQVVQDKNPEFTKGRTEQVTGYLLGYSDTSAVRHQLKDK